MEWGHTLYKSRDEWSVGPSLPALLPGGPTWSCDSLKIGGISGRLCVFKDSAEHNRIPKPHRCSSSGAAFHFYSSKPPGPDVGGGLAFPEFSPKIFGTKIQATRRTAIIANAHNKGRAAKQSFASSSPVIQFLHFLCKFRIQLILRQIRLRFRRNVLRDLKMPLAKARRLGKSLFNELLDPV